jgi:hypothetical protein
MKTDIADLSRSESRISLSTKAHITLLDIGYLVSTIYGTDVRGNWR